MISKALKLSSLFRKLMIRRSFYAGILCDHYKNYLVYAVYSPVTASGGRDLVRHDVFV